MDRESPQHTHHFNQHQPKAGEKRTWLVIVLTTITMAGEIVSGILFGSMALLADGLHMASHATALSISAFAYFYARRRAHDERFCFGTGKVNSLAGFSSAILLVVFALYMMGESVHRMVNPVVIAFDEAILVAFIGLFVNLVSMFILRVNGHDHESATQAHAHDHNLRAAYLHVLADTLTSVLAIIALFNGKYFGLTWMDPLMGIVGAIMISRWSIGLLKETSRVLLDRQAREPLLSDVKNLLEKDGRTKVTDLHIWSIGSNNYTAVITVESDPDLDSVYHHRKIDHLQQILHCTIEIRANF